MRDRNLTPEERAYLKRERDRLMRERNAFRSAQSTANSRMSLAGKCLAAADGDGWVALELAIGVTRREMRESGAMVLLIDRVTREKLAA